MKENEVNFQLLMLLAEIKFLNVLCVFKLFIQTSSFAFQTVKLCYSILNMMKMFHNLSMPHNFSNFFDQMLQYYMY